MQGDRNRKRMQLQEGGTLNLSLEKGEEKEITHLGDTKRAPPYSQADRTLCQIGGSKKDIPLKALATRKTGKKKVGESI